MSTIDTSTWSPDSSLNTDIGGIPLNASASIQQTWQAIQMLMAALKGDTAAIKLTINQPDGTTIVATNQTLTVVDNGHAHTIANVTGLQTALDGKASSADMTGATASADGASGLVPKPEAGDQDKVLKGDGTWGNTPTPNLGTASRAVQTDANGVLAVSSVTATELGHLSGVTSAVQAQLNAKADMEDVSSTFTWSNGQSPAHFHAYRVGKLVNVYYQGQSTTHSGGASLGTTTLSVAVQTFIPMVKNASAYGIIDISSISTGSAITVSQISSSTASGRIYFNGSFVLA